jgi:hypothetical protein
MAGKTGKITITSELPEQHLRQLQSLLLRLTAQSVSTEQSIQETGINFVNKVIVQSILDREEWLKGQALFTGALDWTFNGKTPGPFIRVREGDTLELNIANAVWVTEIVLVLKTFISRQVQWKSCTTKHRFPARPCFSMWTKHTHHFETRFGRRTPPHRE